ncbi:T9SS type A sorting domain-containing protein [Flavobacterium amnicola]|uniref:T9SS type A sorting domain-containing protein n=1 Tax=Flavobacterium amnicola TaxID=2506422 RepID=A0A4Q1K2C4_9FLAO|nr:M4 family metallopeptidase [Flavobacterium amnicola]RXR19180.1 T9SS type A sorting domain-containing protein [Flavobacterium amnicola]
MKNKYHLLPILALFSMGTFAQHTAKHETDVPYQKTLKLDQPVSKETAMSQFNKMYNLKAGYTYQTIRTTSDVSGMTHERMQQYFNGIKVEFGTLILHSLNGTVVSVNGELYDASQANLKASLSPDTGLSLAINSVGAQKYLWQDPAQASLMEYSMPKGELVLFSNAITGKVSLAYKYDIYATAPISREDVYVDANSGEILFKNAIIKHATGLISDKQIKSYSDKVEEAVVGKSTNALLTATAATRYSGTKSIETSLDTGLSKYVLNDATRGNGIVTYNSANTNTMPSTHFQDNDNVWTDGNYVAGHASKDNAALDAHWGAMKTFDFWKNTFNRNSFDDANGQIRSYVHYNATNNGTTGWDNAQWTGSVMRYGDGSSFNVLTSVDVIGHEIGHAVCQYTANLVYANQSGAMNEGYSDIWGACIEQYAKFGNLNAGTDTASPGTLGVWKIGEELATNPLRSMSYPLTRNNPDTFLGTRYTDTQDDSGIIPACNTPGSGNDNCGVHNNSGVLNHWFYILTAGKSGTNNASAANGGPDTYNVTGIGMTKSSQIAYYVERDYLTPNAKFSDARTASIAVASALYCASSQEVQSVMNAWYAVNVGTAYVGYANDVALKTISGVSNIACGAPYSASIVFENAGTASISSVSISYNIDGGANTNQTWTGSLANCSTQLYPISISGLTRGTHVLSVTTTITSDGNATNNTKTTVITVNTNGTVNTVNNFNTATDVLVSIDESGTTNNLWQRGTSTKTQLSNTVAGNSPVYATKLAGLYPDATKSYLVSQCYDLSTVTSPMLKFDMAYDLETDWDILYMEYSTDGGATWGQLGTGATANWYSSNRLPNGTDCFNCIGGQWTGEFALTRPVGGGTHGTKRQYSYDLSSFGFGSRTLAPQTNMMFRFVFLSDESATEEGAIIDNFVIEGTLSKEENQFEQFAVYPNPSNGKFNIVLSTTDKVNVQLFDMRGRSVYSKLYNSTGISFNQQIDLSSLSSGVYILNVESNGKKEARRIIIE